MDDQAQDDSNNVSPFPATDLQMFAEVSQLNSKAFDCNPVSLRLFHISYFKVN